MQYSFKDFGGWAENLHPSIQLILNGELIQSDLDGFGLRVLSVSGRGTFEHIIVSTSVVGRHGNIVRGRTIQPRKLEVVAVVHASDNESYRRLISQLMYKLHRQTINTLKFTDDMDYTFYATFDGMKDDKELSNRQEIVLSFTCHDPFKYRDSLISEVQENGEIMVMSQFPIIPDEIDITFANTTDSNEFTITNTTTGDKIVFKNPESTTDNRVFVRIPEREVIYNTTTALNVIHGVDIKNSNFHGFTVDNNSKIVISPTPTSVKIKYRGVYL